MFGFLTRKEMIYFQIGILKHWFKIKIGGDRGIRTPDKTLQSYNGLANRRVQPLCHVSAALSAAFISMCFTGMQ